jgi:glutaminase
MCGITHTAPMVELPGDWRPEEMQSRGIAVSLNSVKCQSEVSACVPEKLATASMVSTGDTIHRKCKSEEEYSVLTTTTTCPTRIAQNSADSDHYLSDSDEDCPNSAEHRQGSKEGADSKDTLSKHLSIFEPCRQNGNVLRGDDVWKFLQQSGLDPNDPRLSYYTSNLNGLDHFTGKHAAALLGSNLIRKALRRQLVVKNFTQFMDKIKEIYCEVKPNKEGVLAKHIPSLASMDPDLWGVAVCTVDGQKFSIGDSKVSFTVQSAARPITYCMALELNGEEKVHQHVGREPSGRNFNDRSLMQQGQGKHSIPHNPYVNAGAMMTCSLVKMDMSEWDRFRYIFSVWTKLCGGAKPGFQNDTFMSERATASRNFCLAYMMEEEGAFPYQTDLQKTLEAYFSWSAMEMTCEPMSSIAATLANGGICPMTSERVFTHQTVTSCLSLMMSCGMYDFSGQFAFQIGLPAKSGDSGVTLVVVPGVCGFATFSPRLDSFGNSVRGIDFSKRLTKHFPYHVFSHFEESKTSVEMTHRRNSRRNSGISDGDKLKRTPAATSSQTDTTMEIKDEDYGSLLWSAKVGDDQRVRQLAACGIEVNMPDHDKRTALHLAASEGHAHMVKLLLALQADASSRDKNNGTPLDDAIRESKNSCMRVLQLAARSLFGSDPNPPLLNSESKGYLFQYFGADTVHEEGDKQKVHVVPQQKIVEVLDRCGFSVHNDPRFSFVKNFPDPFTAEELEQYGVRYPLLSRALRGKLVVPNFSLLCDKFSEILAIVHDEQQQLGEACEIEAFNVMSIDGQVLQLGEPDEYLCAGDLISLALYAATVELVGAEKVMQWVGSEASGVRSDKDVWNTDDLPYNPFMWNGMLALISLLEQEWGDAAEEVERTWSKLCIGSEDMVDEGMYDENWMKEDKRLHDSRVRHLLYTSLNLQKFPDQTPHEDIIEMFFYMRAIKTKKQYLSSIGAVFANRGCHPLTGEQIFRKETVQAMLSMLFAAGCNGQSGEFSFKVGVPAKSTSEGAVLLILPDTMSIGIVSPTVNHNNVSIGALRLCNALGKELNCHVLAGNSTSSSKGDPKLYHFNSDIELCQQLLFAAESSDLLLLSALNQLGFSLDHVDYDGRSAAHIAAGNNQIKALKYLEKKGAKMQAKDRWGYTPYDQAVRAGHDHAACFLKSCSSGNYDEDDFPDDASSISGVSSSNSRCFGFASSRITSKRTAGPIGALAVEAPGQDSDGSRRGSRSSGRRQSVDMILEEA